MFRFSVECVEQLIYSRQAYDYLNSYYDKIEKAAQAYHDTAKIAIEERDEFKRLYEREEFRKRKWRRLFAHGAVLVVGGTVAVITGQVIVVGAVVLVTETIIHVTRKKRKKE